MKLVSLKMHNVFRFGEENNEIVFDDFFGEDSIALICGMVDGNADDSNGAGKSTIFDCIAYALFEKVPRLHAHGSGTGYAVNEIIRTEDDGTIACEDSYVELVLLDDDGEQWTIKRGRKMNRAKTKSSGIFELYCENESKSAQTKGKPQEKINNIVGISYEAFINSVMLVQRDVGKFLTGTNKARKEILLDLLGMNQIDLLLSRVRKRKKTVLERLTGLEGKHDLIRARVESVDLKELKAHLKSLRKDLEERKGQLAELDVKIIAEEEKLNGKGLEKMTLVTDIATQKYQLKNATDAFNSNKALMESDFHSKNAELKNLQEREINLEKLIAECLSEIKEATKGMDEVDKAAIESLNKKIFEAEKAYDILYNDRGILESKKLHLTSEKGRISAKLEACKNEKGKFEELLKGSVDGKVECPSCGVATANDHFNKHIKSVCESEEVAQKEMDECDNKLAEVAKELDKNCNLILEVKETMNKKHEVTATVTRYKNFKEQKAKSEAKLEDRKSELQEVKKKVEGAVEAAEKVKNDYDAFLKTKNADGEKIEVQIKAEEERLKKLSEEIDKIKNSETFLKLSRTTLSAEQSAIDLKINTVSMKIENAEKEQKEFSNIKVEMAKEEVVKNRHLYLEGLLGLKGIKKDIVKLVIPDLNDLINEYLSYLKNGMTVDLVENDKELDIIIRGASASSYHLLSGGEKEAIRIATDVALGMSSLGINGKLPDMLFLDEIFGALDDGTKNGVLRLLKQLSGQFDRILVITHDANLKEKFKNKIWVEKRDGLSTIIK
jgi:DNA repair exonuclease SbcCD ATPase subunit